MPTFRQHIWEKPHVLDWPSEENTKSHFGHTLSLPVPRIQCLQSINTEQNKPPTSEKNERQTACPTESSLCHLEGVVGQGSVDKARHLWTRGLSRKPKTCERPLRHMHPFGPGNLDDARGTGTRNQNRFGAGLATPAFGCLGPWNVENGGPALS